MKHEKRMYHKRKTFHKVISRIKVQNKPVREFYEESSERLKRKAKQGVFLQEEDIKRVLVNSIRHTGSTYDKDIRIIYDLDRAIHSDVYYRRYKNFVLKNIAETYPFLEDECDRQKHEVQMARIVK